MMAMTSLMVLSKHDLYQYQFCRKCSTKYNINATACCNKHILTLFGLDKTCIGVGTSLIERSFVSLKGHNGGTTTLRCKLDLRHMIVVESIDVTSTLSS